MGVCDYHVTIVWLMYVDSRFRRGTGLMKEIMALCDATLFRSEINTF